MRATHYGQRQHRQAVVRATKPSASSTTFASPPGQRHTRPLPCRSSSFGLTAVFFRATIPRRAGRNARNGRSRNFLDCRRLVEQPLQAACTACRSSFQRLFEIRVLIASAYNTAARMKIRQACAGNRKIPLPAAVIKHCGDVSSPVWRPVFKTGGRLYRLR